jgi:hypothetical protein
MFRREEGTRAPGRQLKEIREAAAELANVYDDLVRTAETKGYSLGTRRRLTYIQ